MADSINIGLVGFGCVGQALYEIVADEALPLEISHICVKDKDKPRSIDTAKFTFRYQDLLEDPQVEVIVEVIDDAEAAFQMVKQALVLGKKVVTANKKMVAEHLEELMSLKENGGKLWYEAAVCGSIPIVKTLDQFYNHEPIHEISGIFNGSSNYILSRIEQDGLDYQQALKLAQDKGFAESNPALDVGGHDTMNKLVILLCHAYGIATTPSSLCTVGIQNLQKEDFAFAQEHGYRIKLIAKAVKEAGQVHAFVIPCFVQQSHDLYHVNDEFNAVFIRGKYTDDHLFTGKGAGGAPTAASVIADIYATADPTDYHYHKWQTQDAITYSNACHIPVYLRYTSVNQLEELALENIIKQGTYDQGGYAVGTVSLHNLWSLNTYIDQQGISLVAGSLLGRAIVETEGKHQETVVN